MDDLNAVQRFQRDRIPSCIFYIILNLAVGGSWVGNPNDETSFENNPYVIDYVRVYQKDSYDEDVKRPQKYIY
ncbi:MAG: hypothetical protein ACLRI8_09130 [Agathobacter rectalis]